MQGSEETDRIDNLLSKMQIVAKEDEIMKCESSIIKRCIICFARYNLSR